MSESNGDDKKKMKARSRNCVEKCEVSTSGTVISGASGTEVWAISDSGIEKAVAISDSGRIDGALAISDGNGIDEVLAISDSKNVRDDECKGASCAKWDIDSFDMMVDSFNIECESTSGTKFKYVWDIDSFDTTVDSFNNSVLYVVDSFDKNVKVDSFDEKVKYVVDSFDKDEKKVDSFNGEVYEIDSFDDCVKSFGNVCEVCMKGDHEYKVKKIGEQNTEQRGVLGCAKVGASIARYSDMWRVDERKNMGMS